jgi:hypothetical protein
VPLALGKICPAPGTAPSSRGLENTDHLAWTPRGLIARPGASARPERPDEVLAGVPSMQPRRGLIPSGSAIRARDGGSILHGSARPRLAPLARSRDAATQKSQEGRELSPFGNGFLGPPSVPVSAIAFARRTTATACAAVEAAPTFFRRRRSA